VDDEEQPRGNLSRNRSPELERSPEVEEFFKRLLDKQDPHRSGPGDEAIAAALQAIQGLVSNPEPHKEKPAERSIDELSPDRLAACSHPETSSAGCAGPRWGRPRKQVRGRFPRPRASIITIIIITTTTSKEGDREPNWWRVLLGKSRQLRARRRNPRECALH